MAIARQRLTLDAFLRLPEEKPALELVDGEVTQKVSPKTVHSVIQWEACSSINGFALPRKLARAFVEHRSSYDGMSTVPDVAVFVWDRLPRDARGAWIDDVTYPPDVAIEIASPGQGAGMLERRCRWYVEHGVRVSIRIEPRRRRATAYRLGAEPTVATEGDSLDLGDVIPGFHFDLGALFAVLEPD